MPKFKSILVLLLLFYSLPVYGQIAAAGWCVVQSSSNQSDQSNPDDSFPPQSDESDSSSALGCDIGIGFSLYTHNRLALVAVVGSESIGSGVMMETE